MAILISFQENGFILKHFLKQCTVRDINQQDKFITLTQQYVVVNGLSTNPLTADEAKS